MAKLPKSFYQRDTTQVAQELLGKILVHIINGRRVSGKITEVEAYLGAKDRACHSYNSRRTARTEAMYASGGGAYIYFTYGMHHCFNVVTQGQNVPEAVLIRALEPLEGLDIMEKNRRGAALKNLTTGPGKLAQALDLNKKLNGELLTSSELFIEKAPVLPTSQIVKKSRIGVDYAGPHARLPLRFYIKGNPFISKK